MANTDEMLQRLCITMETLVQHLEMASQDRDRESARRDREYLDLRDNLFEQGRQIVRISIDIEKNFRPQVAPQSQLVTSINGIWTYAKWAVFPALGAATHLILKLLEHSR